MSSTPTALMYAELLSNIRQVSVIASLPTPSTPDTRATLSDDRLQLRLVHNGATVLLILPAQVAAVPSLQQPKLGNREISWRLGLPNTTSTYHGADSAGNPSAPWSASTLSEQSLISCRKCRNSLLATEGSVKSWKDLPSENWAEMMDFWHCHKPSIHKKHTADGHHVTHLDEKGYGANTRFMARRGVGFVDLTYLLLSKEDCPGVKLDQTRDKASMSVSSRDPVYCEQCGTIVGAIDQLADGLRLYKWSLCISTPTSKRPTTYPLSHFLTAHLLSQISSQAINKFILHSSDSDALNQTALNPAASRPTTTHSTSPNSTILYIWVFAPYLTISLSTDGLKSSQPTPASKIFYRPISDKDATALLESASMGVEEVQLPTEVMADLLETLRRSTIAVPESARKFREWDVGFLERFVVERGE